MSIPIDAHIARIARKAADVIEANGWHQGDFYDTVQAAAGLDQWRRRVCAAGALRVAVGEQLDHVDVSLASSLGRATITAALGRATITAFAHWLIDTGRAEPSAPGEGPITVIAGWNDDCCGAADEVTSALRAFADEIERREAA